MSKLVNSIVFISVAFILFYFSGLVTDISLFQLAEFLLSPERWKSENIIFNEAENLISLAVLGGGVVAGFLLGERTQWGIKASLAGVLILIAGDLYEIFKVVSKFDILLALLLIAPLSIAYIIIVINWFGGTDV